MKEGIVRRFLNIDVKLVKENYALYGRILEIDGDCIIFQTKEKTSAIQLDLIQEITPWEIR